LLGVWDGLVRELALGRQETGNPAGQAAQVLASVDDEGRAGFPCVGKVVLPQGDAEADMAEPVMGGGDRHLMLQRLPYLLALPTPPAGHQAVEECVEVVMILRHDDVGGGGESGSGQLGSERQDVATLVGINGVGEDQLWVCSGGMPRSWMAAG
jgi:hypothetical protein